MNFDTIYGAHQVWLQTLIQKGANVSIDSTYFGQLKASEAQISTMAPMHMNFVQGTTFNAELGVMDEAGLHHLDIYSLAHIGIITPKSGTAAQEILDHMRGSFEAAARIFLPPNSFRAGPLHFCVQLQQMVTELPADVKVKTDFGYDEERQAMSLKLGLNRLLPDAMVEIMLLWIEYRAAWLGRLGFFEVTLDADDQIQIQPIEPYLGEPPQGDPAQN